MTRVRITDVLLQTFEDVLQHIQQVGTLHCDRWLAATAEVPGTTVSMSHQVLSFRTTGLKGICKSMGSI